MPSSLICCSEDSSLEPQLLQIKAQGEQTNRRQDEFFGDAFFSISAVWSFIVASLPNASLSIGFPPTVVVLASSMEDVDSPPNLESFGRECFSWSGIFRYFLDLKTPGSAGSAAAHQTYRPKTHVI